MTFVVPLPPATVKVPFEAKAFTFDKANLVLYCLAVFCFGLYFYFSGNNPIKEIRDIIQSIYVDKIKKYYKKITKKSWINQDFFVCLYSLSLGILFIFTPIPFSLVLVVP